MEQMIVTRRAKDAKCDGLTLHWCMVHLIKKLERTEQRIKQQQRPVTR